MVFITFPVDYESKVFPHGDNECHTDFRELKGLIDKNLISIRAWASRIGKGIEKRKDLGKLR
jgi:hypothetical protein